MRNYHFLTEAIPKELSSKNYSRNKQTSEVMIYVGVTFDVVINKELKRLFKRWIYGGFLIHLKSHFIR